MAAGLLDGGPALLRRVGGRGELPPFLARREVHGDVPRPGEVEEQPLWALPANR